MRTVAAAKVTMRQQLQKGREQVLRVVDVVGQSARARP